MVDNKSKTSLISHIQKKYINHEDNNTRATHLKNIIFICDIAVVHLGVRGFITGGTLKIGILWSVPVVYTDQSLFGIEYCNPTHLLSFLGLAGACLTIISADHAVIIILTLDKHASHHIFLVYKLF